MGLRGDVSKGDVVSILLRVRDILQRAIWASRVLGRLLLLQGWVSGFHFRSPMYSGMCV